MAETVVLDRETSPERFEAFVDIVEALLDEKNPGRKPARADLSAYLSRAVEKGPSYYLVRFGDDGRAEGVVLMSACGGFAGDWLFFHEIFVRADRRGAGLGAALCAASFAWGRAKKLKSFATCTEAENTAALALGDGLGLTREAMFWRERDL